MKTILAIAIFFLPQYLQQTNADDILGIWEIPNGLELMISRKGDTFEGKVVSCKNPDKTQLGKTLLSGLKYNKKSKIWEEGKLYVPDKGITVNIEILEASAGKLKVHVSKFIINKEVNWIRCKM